MAMLVSELISKLQQLQAEHGDIPVLLWGYDNYGYNDVAEVSQVYHKRRDNLSYRAYQGLHDEVYSPVRGSKKGILVG